MLFEKKNDMEIPWVFSFMFFFFELNIRVLM